jgi:competence protein CoiA
MALRCLDDDGCSIQAFDLSPDDWRDLKRRNREADTLRMPCCASRVILKCSHKGTQFFAHASAGECTTAPETEVHLRLKQIAVEVARSRGWNAETEVTGATPTGERWQADVLASKGDHKVAVEVQWSGQTNDETLRRQNRYRQSGIRCLWLFRRKGFPASFEVPAVQVIARSGEDLTVRFADDYLDRRVPIRKFFDAVFDSRLKYGFPLGMAATVSIRAAPITCWSGSCGAGTTIITGVDVKFGGQIARFTIPDLDEFPAIFSAVRDRLPADPRIGEIKPRFSKTQGRSYLSNGCAKCDSLVGQFFEIEARWQEAVISEFSIVLSEHWKEAIERHEEGHEFGWDVYEHPDTAAVERVSEPT